MDAELKASLSKLIAQARNGRSRIGDLTYDTLVAALADLMNSRPNYGYVQRIVSNALQPEVN